MAARFRPWARQRRQGLPDRSMVEADQSVTYVIVFTVITALTIGGTRAFLAATGYPQVGGKVFHLAHALWGGLLLTITTVLLLVVANNWARAVAAVAGGVGCALFVDEVGKFMTQANNYFFPLAATVVYVFLMLLAALAYALHRSTGDTPRAHLYTALELTKASIDGGITQSQAERIQAHITRASEATNDPRLLGIAAGLQKTLDATSERRPDSSVWTNRWSHRLRALDDRFLTTRNLRFLAILGLAGVVIVAIGWVITLFVWAIARIPLGQIIAADAKLGPATTTIALLGMAVWIAGGIFAAMAIKALMGSQPNRHDAVRYGTIATLLVCILGNGLLVYFNQFAIMVDLFAQVATLMILGRWAVKIARQDDAKITGAPMQELAPAAESVASESSPASSTGS